MSRRHKNKTLAITSILAIAVWGCLLLWASSRLFDLERDAAGTVTLIFAIEVLVIDTLFTTWYFLVRHRRRS